MKFKKLIGSFLNKRGYGLKRLYRNFDDILEELFDLIYSSGESLVCFDVGAHEGSSIDRFRRISKNASIYSFEPSRTMFQTLLERYGNDPDVTLVNVGVSDKEGELIFNQHLSSSGSSSFAGTVHGTYFALRRGIQRDTIDQYNVKTESLSGYCVTNGIERIHLLKIDVQGYEEEVIRGCKRLLQEQRIDIIEAEVIVSGVYDKRTSFYDLEKGLLEYGYKLIALSNDGRFYNFGPFDILSNKELQFDVIYVSDRIWASLTVESGSN